MVVVNSFGKSKNLIKHQEFLYVAGLPTCSGVILNFSILIPFFGQRSAPSPYWPPTLWLRPAGFSIARRSQKETPASVITVSFPQLTGMLN